MKMKEVALLKNGFENADVMLQCVFDWAIIPGIRR